jgi:hypothetical protein
MLYIIFGVDHSEVKLNDAERHGMRSQRDVGNENVQT